jgi:GTP-binding protein
MKRIGDEVNIRVSAGNGGKGCDSHIRLSEKKFLPTGGEGGRGGNVIVRADANVSSLKDFHYHRHFEAESGTPGGSNHKKGKRGKDLVIAVPCGTLILEREKHFLIRDLVRNGDEVVLLQGGRGGSGNAGGKEAQPGEPGESLEITLSLMIPSEVFLVGLPNAGKSKLLNRLTHAHSKVETYPFSTKLPELGIYESPHFKQIRICELPAVYRESPEGRGAGVDFLKHLHRAKLILFVLDPVNQFASSLDEGCGILREVLERYEKSFLEIPQAVVVNKMDLPEARTRLEKEKFRPAAPLFLISAETGEGIEPLMRFVAQKIEEPANV